MGATRFTMALHHVNRLERYVYDREVRLPQHVQVHHTPPKTKWCRYCGYLLHYRLIGLRIILIDKAFNSPLDPDQLLEYHGIRLKISQMVGLTGLEPAWEGLEIPCKSFLRQPHKIIIKLHMVVGFEPTRPPNSLPGLVNVDFNHSDHRLQYRTLLRQRVSLSAIP